MNFLLCPVFIERVSSSHIFFSAAKFPTIPSTLSVENDAILAKMACNVGYEFKRRVTTYSLSCSLMEYAVSMFT